MKVYPFDTGIATGIHFMTITNTVSIMDKHYLDPQHMLSIATQHAESAETLLNKCHDASYFGKGSLESLAPVTSLLYTAFQLTLKAYCMHDHRPVKQYKSLRELVELNLHLGFSSQQLGLLRTLSQQQAFIKGIDYELWEDEQQLRVFCEKLLDLFAHLQSLIPLELTKDYLEF